MRSAMHWSIECGSSRSLLARLAAYLSCGRRGWLVQRHRARGGVGVGQPQPQLQPADAMTIAAGVGVGGPTYAPLKLGLPTGWGA